MSNRIFKTFRSGDRIGDAWCSLMHDSPRWPIHGYYECGVCGRRYLVPWGRPESAGAAARMRPPLPTLSSAILPALLLLFVLAGPVRGAERPSPDDPAAAAEAALQRYIAGQEKGGSWPVELIEIQASLPKWKKIGKLRAIRRIVSTGAPNYKVLEFGGDPTVEHQVISRYITADERAAALPAASSAITPANYKIRFVGTVSGPRVAYAFRVIPRRKREGLINGVLWLDGETGVALRESGYLAKSPSSFVKRINLTRESDLDNGSVTVRITHVAVEMRLVGRAQLVILERPLALSGVSAFERNQKALSEAIARGPDWSQP